MKAYNKETGVLFFKSAKGFTVNLEIRRPITKLLGDSATGKSFIVGMILVNKESEETNSMDAEFSFSNIEVIKGKKDLGLLSSTNPDLFIIDRSDYVLEDEDIELIKKLSVYKDFLVIGRGVVGLNLSPNYIAELYEKDKTFFLYYRYSVKGWW